MDADLVRPPGAEFGLDERHRAQPLDRAEHRPRSAAAASRREGGAPGAGAGTADVPIDQTLPGQLTPDQREIAAIDAVGPELALQALGGVVGEGEDEQARGFTVESVHDQHPPVVPRATLDLRAGSAHHRVVLAFGRGVHEQSGGLVDHEDLRVEVDHLDRRDLCGANAFRQAGIVRHDVAGRDHRAGVRSHDPVDQDVSDENLAFGSRVGSAEHRLSRPREPSGRWIHQLSLAPRLSPVDSTEPVGVG